MFSLANCSGSIPTEVICVVLLRTVISFDLEVAKGTILWVYCRNTRLY